MNLLVYILGSAGVALTALVTYIVAKKKNSGEINTSDAATLWSEATKMRTDLYLELVASRAESERLRLEIVALREAIGILTDTLKIARQKGFTNGG